MHMVNKHSTGNWEMQIRTNLQTQLAKITKSDDINCSKRLKI